MTRDQITKLNAAVTEIENRQQAIRSQRTKAERDAFVADAMAEGRWPALDGLDQYQRGAVLAAKRA